MVMNSVMKSYHCHKIISCLSNHIMFMKSNHVHEIISCSSNHIMFMKSNHVRETIVLYCIAQELQCRKSSAAMEVQGVDSRDWNAGTGVQSARVQKLKFKDWTARTPVQGLECRDCLTMQCIHFGSVVGLLLDMVCAVRLPAVGLCHLMHELYLLCSNRSLHDRQGLQL